MKIQLIMLDTPIIVIDEKINIGDYGLVFGIGSRGKNQGYFHFKHDGGTESKLNSICQGARKIIAGIEELPAINWNGLKSFIYTDISSENKKPKVFDIEVEMEIIPDYNNYGNGEIFHSNKKENPRVINNQIKILNIKTGMSVEEQILEKHLSSMLKRTAESYASIDQMKEQPEWKATINAMIEYGELQVSRKSGDQITGSAWIAIKDQEPPDYTRVLYFDTRDESMHVGFFVCSQTPIADYITHWMKLPTKP